MHEHSHRIAGWLFAIDCKNHDRPHLNYTAIGVINHLPNGRGCVRLLPQQGLFGKIEMHAASLERGDAHNSIDSREHVCGG